MNSIKRFAAMALLASVGFAMTASAAETNELASLEADDPDRVVTIRAEDSDEATTLQTSESDEVPATAAAPQDVTAERRAAAQKVVDDAVATLQHFEADSAQAWFRENVKKARAIFIVPRYGKGGFIFGGAGGRGLVVVRDRETGAWSQPAFYTVGAATIGLQIGAQESEMIYLVMTDAGMSALMDTKFQLGADGTVVGGPVGLGAQAATTDVFSFSRGKGLFGGITAEGAVIQPDFKRNSAYYGEPVSASEILLKNSVRSVDTEQLITQVSATAAPN